MRLDQREIEDVAGLLLAFYDAWLPPDPLPDAVRIYVELSGVPWIDWHPGMAVPPPPLLPLRYVDSVVMEDPLSGVARNLMRGPGSPIGPLCVERSPRLLRASSTAGL